MRNTGNPDDPVLRWESGEFVLDGAWQVSVNGIRLVIPSGFRFDLSSIPRVFRILADRTELGVKAPLVHDFIYRCRGQVPEELILPASKARAFKRYEADRYFLMLMKADGIGKMKRWFAWLGVRLGGWLPWPPEQTLVNGVALKTFHTFWQAGVAVAVASGWGIPLVAAGLALVKSTVWPWVRDSVQSVTY